MAACSRVALEPFQNSEKEGKSMKSWFYRWVIRHQDAAVILMFLGGSLLVVALFYVFIVLLFCAF